MKETANFEDIREDEKNKREEQKGVLENLPGFQRLSKNQKRYILNSLYVQQRAERGTDPISASRIQTTPSKFRKISSDIKDPYIAHSTLSLSVPPEEDKRYASSQIHIMINFCHQVIDNLEDNRAGAPLPSSWTEAGRIDSYTELEELISLAKENSDFPLVVEIWAEKPNDDDFANLGHTTLLLGKNSQGEYMAWEKSGWHMPFKIVQLKDVYETYKDLNGWRIRPLSV